MLSLVDRFLALFADLEHEIAAIAGRQTQVQSFAENLREAVAKDRRVYAKRALLDACRELRNVLVHLRFQGGFVAEPSPEIVDALEQTLRMLQSTPQVVQHFRRELKEFCPEDLISDVLAYTSANNFSQVVVREDGRLGLLSSNTIHRWLASQVSLGLVELAVPIRTVLSYRESDCDEIHFAPRHTTLEQALDLFRERQPRKIVALVITENGRAEQKPLAFLTVWDLAEAARLVGS